MKPRSLFCFFCGTRIKHYNSDASNRTPQFQEALPESLEYKLKGYLIDEDFAVTRKRLCERNTLILEIDMDVETIAKSRIGIWQTVGLHLIPGVLISTFFFLTAPAVIHSGYPPIMALYLAILLILIPFEYGFLLFQGKRENGRYSLNGVVLLREKLLIWQIALLVILLLAWCLAVFMLLPSVDTILTEKFFSWLPDWSLPSGLMGNLGQNSKSALIVTYLVGFILNGIAGPIVEELYFRGYLLPRIPASRRWAPLINVLLFSLYHFFSPWQNATRIIALVPLVYAVSKKRNVYISIFTHCLLNTLGILSGLLLLFR